MGLISGIRDEDELNQREEIVFIPVSISNSLSNLYPVVEAFQLATRSLQERRSWLTPQEGLNASTRDTTETLINNKSVRRVLRSPFFIQEIFGFIRDEYV